MKYLCLLLLSTMAWAEIDPLNTYQWNRKNELANNGQIDKKPWFEWWYYKLVLPEQNQSFYFIYGVVNPWDQSQTLKGTHAYVGAGDFTRKEHYNEVFKVNQFDASYDETRVTVGPHTATNKNIEGLLIHEKGHQIEWNIDFKKKWAFKSEGWMLGKNISDIEWYPAQADAVCSGHISVDGKVYEFDKAPCYQDRNWGKQFPKWWTWIVSNHFIGHPDTALAIGGGQPHILGRQQPLSSVVVGFKHKGKTYEFRPNHFNPIQMEINFGTWEVTATKYPYQLKVSGTAPKDIFMDLQFIDPQGNVFHDYEALTGEVTVKLYHLRVPFKPLLLEAVKSEHAGLEYGSHDLLPL